MTARTTTRHYSALPLPAVLRHAARRHFLTSSVAPAQVAGNLPPEALELLSPNERQYDLEYGTLLSEFQTAYDLDLTRDTKPPSDLYIKVLAREELGAFIGAESGATIDSIRAGDTVFLRRGDVEPLIRQGKLEHLAE